MSEAGATAEQPLAPAQQSLRERIEPWVPLIAIVAIAFFIGLTSAARYHFPIAAGGLFLDAAQRIGANDYRLPATLPHYTDGGVPFAYPPLMLYVLSALHDVTGVSLLNLERVLPVLYTPIYLIPFYFLAKDVVKDRNTALFATFIMAVSPSAFFYHFDAGGVVRSPGFTFLIFGLLATYRMFETGETRWVVASSLSFALTLLTHVGYAAMFGASYLVFYAFLDRSWPGMVKAALAMGAAVLIASPWWIAVVHEHGTDAFRAALLTHRSAAGTVYRTVTLTIDREPFLPIWHVLGSVGLLVMIARGRFFLPVWLAALILAYPPEESLMLVLSMTAAITVFEIVLPAVRSSQSDVWRGYGPAIVVGALGLYGIGSALALVQSVPRSDVDVWHPYIDQSDIDAMEWAKANTDANAQFMVVGLQAEWFPAFSERTSVVGEWGAEWERGEFKRQQQMFSDMLDCQTRLQDCLLAVRADNNLHADFAYVPETDDTISLRHSIEETPSWQTVYEHDGVAIYRMPPNVVAVRAGP